MLKSTGELIAKKAGCSVSTVSRVLNNSASVSPKVRQAVLEAVRSSGSVPRVHGRRSRQPAVRERVVAAGMVEILMVRRTPMETVVLEDGKVQVGSIGSLTLDRFFSPEARYANSFFRQIVDGAVDELTRFKHRGVLNVAPSLADPQLLMNVNANANRGLLLLGDYAEDVHPFLEKVRCPVVSLITWPRDGWPDYVGIDNFRGISVIFDHLRELGHSKIAYVAGNTNSAVFQERLLAYRLKMTDASLPYREEWVIGGTNHIGTIEQNVCEVLSRVDRPTAIMCCYDGAAIAVRRAAERLGLSVPGDVSVTGFDDEDIAELFTPALTTARVPTHEMGRRAVQVLMMRSQHYPDDHTEGCSLRVTPRLIVRQSTGPVQQAGQAETGPAQ